MKTNFYVESQQFCYVYNKYKIEKINGVKYIVPEKEAGKQPSVIADRINEIMIKLLNIGKKAYHNEEIEDIEILEFVTDVGFCGFMSDFPINRYYFLDEEVILRDYNFVEYADHIKKIELVEYIKIFMPKLTEKQIEKIIEKCKKNITPTVMEKYLTPDLNKKLIYSEDYAEPIDMIVKYASLLYEALVSITERDYTKQISPIIRINNCTNTMDRISSGIGIKFNYLKQAVDLNFLINVTQDVSPLKICKFCGNAFIATNIKAEYDSPNCKNKANVYKFRAKNASDEN